MEPLTIGRRAWLFSKPGGCRGESRAFFMLETAKANGFTLHLAVEDDARHAEGQKKRELGASHALESQG